MTTFYADTESCGFTSIAFLIQWGRGNKEVNLHDVWYSPVRDTLQLIEYIATGKIVGFNLSHDAFILQKTYNVLALLQEKHGPGALPVNYVEEVAFLEELARDHDACVNFTNAVDLMLIARKTKYQQTMDRKPIFIRRVPLKAAHKLSEILADRLPLPKILFVKSKKGCKWELIETQQKGFFDVKLSFAPSTAMKLILIDAGLREDDRLQYKDVATHFMNTHPVKEFAFAPFATAVSHPRWNWEWRGQGKKGWAWPYLFDEYSAFWSFNEIARKYAADDVTDLELLEDFLEAKGIQGDRDSELATMAGAVRWKGFSVDEDKIRELYDEAKADSEAFPTTEATVRASLNEVMTPDEQLVFIPNKERPEEESTKRMILEEISRWDKPCECVTYKKEKVIEEVTDPSGLTFKQTTYKKIPIPDVGCPTCGGKGTVPHPAAARAKGSLKARQGNTKKALYEKILIAGRLHASASIVGSLSGRQSGRTEAGDGDRQKSINAMGIQRDKRIRSAFTLAPEGMDLNLGDFDAFEIVIALAGWKDEVMEQDLLTCFHCKHVGTREDYNEGRPCTNCGSYAIQCKTCRTNSVDTDPSKCPKCGSTDIKVDLTRRKLHGLFAMALSGLSYEEVIASSGTDDDWYVKGKNSVFGGLLYGGDEGTLHRRVGIPIEDGRRARNEFYGKYTGVQAAQTGIIDAHASMQQPGGIGTNVIWNDPKEYVESLTGFRRYFTLENEICKTIYDLSGNLPKELKELKGRVKRNKEREQSESGATMSALYGAAFQLQAACVRAAMNHVIQSTGAELTKMLEHELWQLQPKGVGPWKVMCYAVHDECITPTVPELADKTKEIVDDFINRMRELVPLLRMEWAVRASTWAEK